MRTPGIDTIRYGSLLLCDPDAGDVVVGAPEWALQRALQESMPVRARHRRFFDRRNVAHTYVFRVCRQHADLATAKGFVREHSVSIAAVGTQEGDEPVDTVLWSSPGGNVVMRNAVMESASILPAGATTYTTYTIHCGSLDTA